jgi:hypothetical protein
VWSENRANSRAVLAVAAATAYDHEIRPEWGQDAMHNQI